MNFPDNFPPIFDGAATFRVNVGETSVYTFTVTDDSNSPDVTVQGPDAYSLTSNGDTFTFSWTVTGVIDYSLMFVAVDSMNAVSTLSPRVEICACQNNGVCTLEGILGTMGNVIDMQCECTPGI